MQADARVVLELLFRRERPQILATLIRLTGDFGTAEDALQEALADALTRWPRDGVPPNPAAWVTTVARRRAVDVIRRARNFRRKTEVLERLQRAEPASHEPAVLESEGDGVPRDDRLRLLFTCCHPALSLDSQVALTLRMVAGLSTRAIARAFLASESTMAQRLVRSKDKIRTADIPFRVPAPGELADRLDAVLAVIYLIFNESYTGTGGVSLIRSDLCEEAIRLARLLDALMPAQPEVEGLLALLLLHSARNPARVNAQGQLVTLEQQDRTLWDRSRIEEGQGLVEGALKRGRAGPYQIQAAIAALHCTAAAPAATDWPQIAALYRLLLHMQPSPIIELNYAVAMGLAFNPAAGLRIIAEIEARGELGSYHLLPVARGELLLRQGETARALESFGQALALCQNPAEQDHLRRRLTSLGHETC